MPVYKLVFSNGEETLIDEQILQWIKYHGAKGVLQVIAIMDENGANILESDEKLKQKLMR